MVKHLKLIINNPKKIDKFFDKKELQLILNLYASMVSNGEWKDYGLNISKEDVYSSSGTLGIKGFILSLIRRLS